ncbi:MAG: hypothetical protein GIW99_08990 [Candidatus Eremiobacteraeota bacterium]|nr:hypothetical protein [Candidatus Eremiobacteraeota bacterium]MBC5827798.1 hypothetical protein [Candidatus Eremiobacteraeota bacterium]
MNPKITRSAWIALLLSAGCSHQGGSGQAPQAHPTATIALANQTGFPLPAGATVIAARSFSQTVSAGQAGRSPLTAGSAGTYAGQEVIARTPDSFSTAAAWLRGQAANPPAGIGYNAAAASKTGNVQKMMNRDGLDYGVFQDRNGDKRRVILVIVMDPAAAKQKLGFALDMAARYRALPAALRGPLDAQVKDRTGFSIEEALAPESPTGIALSAIDQFAEKDQRAVILVDARRQ